MKRVFTILAMLVLMSGAAQADPTFDSDAINAHCAEKWAGDFDMQGYCRKKIITAFASYQTAKQIAQTASGDLIVPYENCESKWGIQWDMVEYCAKRQLDGLYELVAIADTLPGNPRAVIVGGCYDKWHPQFDMMAYCMRKQADAWRELNSSN